MRDNVEARANLSILSQSDGWRIICEEIDQQIERIDRIINDDSVGCEDHDRIIYTPRVLNIKLKKILQKLKKYPETLSKNLEGQFSDDQFMSEMGFK